MSLSRRSFLGSLVGGVAAVVTAVLHRPGGRPLPATTPLSVKELQELQDHLVASGVRATKARHPRGRVTRVLFRAEWREFHVFTETDMWRVYPPADMLVSAVPAALRREGFDIHDAQVFGGRPQPYPCQSDAAKRIFLGGLA